MYGARKGPARHHGRPTSEIMSPKGSSMPSDSAEAACRQRVRAGAARPGDEHRGALRPPEQPRLATRRRPDVEDVPLDRAPRVVDEEATVVLAPHVDLHV